MTGGVVGERAAIGHSRRAGGAQPVAEDMVDAVAAEPLEARRRRGADVEVAAQQHRSAGGPGQRRGRRRAMSACARSGECTCAWRFAHHGPPSSATAWQTRRSGQRRSSTCGAR